MSTPVLLTQPVEADATEGIITTANPLPMSPLPDLKLGAKSITLTMSSGTGSVAIPDTATCIGVKPSSTTMRVGLEAPATSDGTHTGAAALTDLAKGCPVDSGQYTWFYLGVGASRTLYVAGGSTDVIEVVVM